MRKFLKNIGNIRELFQKTRSRIILFYFLITTIFMAITVPIFYYLVIQQADQRIIEDLEEEIEVFEYILSVEKEVQNLTEMQNLFNEYFRYKIPGDKTFLIAIVDNKFYRSSPVSIPYFIKDDLNFIQNMSTIKELV